LRGGEDKPLFSKVLLSFLFLAFKFGDYF